jgi:hypothetical protein
VKPGPWLGFLGGDGVKAFSYSEIRWKEGLGRAPVFSSNFNRDNWPGGIESLDKCAGDESASIAFPSRGGARSPGAGSWSGCKPYWEVFARSNGLVELIASLGSAIRSGCIKSGAKLERERG